MSRHITFLISFLVWCIAGVAPAAAAPAINLNNAMSPAAAGDMPAALAGLAALAPDNLNEKDRATRSCVLGRFAPDADEVHAFPPVASDVPAKTAAILVAYRHYWRSALLHNADLQAAEDSLRKDLISILPDGPGANADFGDWDSAVKRAIEAQGWFALTGKTAPLHELMLWRSQTIDRTPIKLPGGSIRVDVVLLDNFESTGWLGFGTCERWSTGGWAADGRIYALRPKWDLDSEDFRVSLIAHESQHYRDYLAFPKLGQPDLEYRAKLVELAVSRRTTYKLLESFAQTARVTRDNPHPFAEYWVVQRVRTRLGHKWNGAFEQSNLRAIPAFMIQRAAAAELNANTAQLRSRGAKSVVSVLPD